MNVTPIKTRVFKEGEDLAAFIREHIPQFADGSVLAVTSKIVALAEGRTAAAADKDRLVAEESTRSRDVQYGKVTLKDGILMWNAGIDSSNAGPGKIVLLPRDSYAAADTLRKQLMEAYGIKKLGILLTDSRIMPLRVGVVGIALGYAGIKGVFDYRGKTDIFNDVYQVTRTDIADSLATAATLMMGEGSEQQPLCVIENAPVAFTDEIDRAELIIPPEEDMYGPLFSWD